MIHPLLDLPTITAELEQLGFVQITALQFERALVVIQIKDGIIPEGAQDLCTPFFRVKIHSRYSDRYAQFDCDATELIVFVNSSE